MMLCASVFKLALCLTVSGSGVIVLCIGVLSGWITILILLFITAGALVEHLSTAVSTVYQSGQRIDVPFLGGTVLGFTDFLNSKPCFFVHNASCAFSKIIQSSGELCTEFLSL